VWLVDWHKNFIRVVLPKSTEIYQKIVFVRQRQLDFFNFRNIRKKLTKTTERTPAACAA